MDTGASDSYVNEAVAVRLKLKRRVRPPFSVGLAVQDKACRITEVAEVPFELGSIRGKYDFNILARAGADVILGCDFMKRYDLVPDVVRERVILKGGEYIAMIEQGVRNLSLTITLPATLTAAQQHTIRKLCKPEYFASAERPFGRVRDWEHPIDVTINRPITSALRRTSPADRITVREEVQKMLSQGAIRPCSSEWASPITLVPKKDGTTRFCIDYRRLNEYTVKDRHPLPRVDDMLASFRGAKYFTSLDAASGYWQIPVREEDIPKTAFICTEGQFEWLVMPFGLCNAPATYQRMMHAVLGNMMYNSVVCYIDDILIYSRSFEEHVRHLKEVFDRLHRWGLLLKPAKCEFLKSEIAFLGHIVTAQGVRTDPKKLEKVAKFPRPTNVKEMRAFLGLAGYYRRFIKGFATISAPLTDLTAKGAWNWSPECEKAFEQVKTALVSGNVCLEFPDFTRPFIIDCDASVIGMGAVLSQDLGQGERPLVFESRKFTPAERKWHIRELEALAILEALRKFRCYILGAKFVVRTDHQSLEWLFKAPSGRLQRWALALAEFTPFDIQYRKGTAHSNVDAFTRTFAESECLEDHMLYGILPQSFQLPSREDLWQAQSTDPTVPLVAQGSGMEYEEGILGLRDEWRWRPFLPQSLWERVIRELHEHPIGGHFGPTRIRKLLAQFFVANISGREVRALLSKCELCARRKPVQPHGPLRSEVPDTPWGTVAMDFCGPYPESGGYKYVLVFIDQFTKWVELVPTRDQEAMTVLRAFYDAIITNHGCPLRLLSDNGPSFRSKLVDVMCSHFGIKKIFSTAYYPQGDGYAERFMRTLNHSLSCLTAYSAHGWHQYLSGIKLGYNITDHRAIGTSPYELNRGRLPNLPTPGESTYQNDTSGERRKIPGEQYVAELREIICEASKRARDELTRYYEKMAKQYNKSSRAKDVNVGDYVLVRLSDYEIQQHWQMKKLAPRWSAPLKVLEVAKDKSWCKVEGDKSGIEKRVNTNRVLPMGQDTWVREQRPTTRKVEVETPEAVSRTRRDSSSSDSEDSFGSYTLVVTPARQPMSEGQGAEDPLDSRPQPTTQPLPTEVPRSTAPYTPSRLVVEERRERPSPTRAVPPEPPVQSRPSMPYRLPERIIQSRFRGGRAYKVKWLGDLRKNATWVTRDELLSTSHTYVHDMVSEYDRRQQADREARGVRPVGRPRKRSHALAALFSPSTKKRRLIGQEE